ncbi:hypothetical protein K469DRAFT_755413 [Zopfia rhizophila CBS 207.26]|uniref:ATP-grasp domain-containing protein n=1 Tax=Zopfia rhizophila CBS 207.26 TaxID=1314779 RepID=A0A6A6DBP8_9PEZI|nr:hypothetical protein K469DRAFT_755413 [Zopfia rhizophila CBS 207.26]
MPIDTNSEQRRLNVLLSNGRFPVSLDLARQLYNARHRVFTVDPMEFHVCKFSWAVKKSWQTPAPSIDPAGYIAAVKKAIQQWKIDIIIPIHEEILFLAESMELEITSRLFSPTLIQLYQLHNKWEYNEVLGRCGLDRPEAYFCTKPEDVEQLDRTRQWALKPILGRSSTGVHHLKPGKELDYSTFDLSPNNPHIAQEWLFGNRYCTYGVFRKGRVQAFCIYPVIETIDGSSSVFFEAVEHDEIKAYIVKLAEKLQISGQLAFDFVETGVTESEMHRGPHGLPRGGRCCGLGKRRSHKGPNYDGPGQAARADAPHRIVSIECNPRATSGIHLWSGTPHLARSLTDVDISLPELQAKPGRQRQTGPGMLMWNHKKANFKRYLQHLGRLLGTRDVMWSWKDMVPMLMQPFLLASYYRICHNKGGIPLPEMFQSDLVWEPGKFGESKKMGLDVGRPLEETEPHKILRPDVDNTAPEMMGQQQ